MRKRRSSCLYPPPVSDEAVQTALVAQNAGAKGQWISGDHRVRLVLWPKGFRCQDAAGAIAEAADVTELDRAVCVPDVCTSLP